MFLKRDRKCSYVNRMLVSMVTKGVTHISFTDYYSIHLPFIKWIEELVDNYLHTQTH